MKHADQGKSLPSHTCEEPSAATANTLDGPTQDGSIDMAMDFAATEPTQASSMGSNGRLPFPNWERYEIRSFLGAGGMGAVYSAVDPRLKRRVAIKFLSIKQLGDAAPRQRRHFEREARAQASIEHPHICKIYEVGEIEGQPFIVMQLIAGSSMAGLLHVMTREQHVRALQQIAGALAAAHAKGLIHRDLKPGNIMVERRPDGTYWPYLMDFGLAREIDSSTNSTTGIEGTPSFMAPEQVRGEKSSLDRRTDVYGFGAALYNVLVGRPPFVGSSADVMIEILTQDPPPLRKFDPSISSDLETIVLKCLEKDPRRRYESASGLAEDLTKFLDGERIAARPPGLLHRMGKFARRHKLLVASSSAALFVSLILGALLLRGRWEAAEQARLAQHLGQEIKDMEWMLRSGRQMPLHDLNREKAIIRKRMVLLHRELAGYGAKSRGLAHYALGRGHLALHEYPEALDQLSQAIKHGDQNAEAHYALGLALGKHFEQAMYEARLSGGGDWAHKQLKEIEPKYLAPAITSLLRSRAMKRNAPGYLDALIAFYQRDYEATLKHAGMALQQEPWLYEASKLIGDVHQERALAARDSGRYEEAEREFASAVRSYQDAAAVGQSDGEAYEGLAECWIRQIEMALNRGQSTEAAYREAVSASDKIATTEPKSIAGPLKRAYAALMTMAVTGSGLSSAARVQQCLASAEAVLEMQPGNPYASDVAAGCYSFSADGAPGRGEDPEPLLRKALSLLEPAVRQAPHFLWGINDLGYTYSLLGSYLQIRHEPSAVDLFEKALLMYKIASSLDNKFALPFQNALDTRARYIDMLASEQEVAKTLSSATEDFDMCMKIDHKRHQCYNNYFIVYAKAAWRTHQAGRDGQLRLAQALSTWSALRKLGGNYLDMEQHAALSHLVEASIRLRNHMDPGPALAEMQAALSRCFVQSAGDAMCQTLAAQAEWIESDWLAIRHKPSFPALQQALEKATVATKARTNYPDAWQVLAETHLRIARATEARSPTRESHLAAGLAAIDRAFLVNPNHALSRATQGALMLARAQGQQTPSARLESARGAIAALERAVQADPFIAQAQAPLLAQAQELLVSP